ncbi:hypothetical protein [Streptomyces sp. BH104]|uniref:hypothetical protein n=1 Tax=Streptomyces sp. BH104 TaxID=3410407 RepID=UPI003BB5E7D8
MIEVRAMNLGDVDAVSALRVSGWRAAYAGIVPRSYLAAMSTEQDAARHRDSAVGGLLLDAALSRFTA